MPSPRPRIGFLIDALDADQLTRAIARAARDHPEVDVMAFQWKNGTPEAPCPVPFANASEAYGFTGVLVACDVDSAARISSFPGPSKRIFLAWDLDWIRKDGRDFGATSAAFRSPRVKVVARSESHKAAIEDAWNIDGVAVVDGIDIPALLEA